MGFLVKNPGIYEMVDGFGVNLRGFTTISIDNSLAFGQWLFTEPALAFLEISYRPQQVEFPEIHPAHISEIYLRVD